MSPRGRGERGNAATLFALVLPLLLGFAALVIDVGHLWLVRNQLQNAADAAALAGVRDLDGTTAQFAAAIQSAKNFAALHYANGTTVTVPDGDVRLGTWDFATRTFTPALAPPWMVNAVEVVTRRSGASGDPVQTYFAPFLGVSQENVTNVAIAVGGSPNQTCGFPIALPDCSLYDDAGNLECNASLTFGNGTVDNAAWTIFSPTKTPDTPTTDCFFATALGLSGASCPKNCNCSSKCNDTSVGEIKVGNGNNFSQFEINAVKTAVQAAGANPVFVQLPVFSTGGVSHSQCGKYVLSNTQTIVGYVSLRITGASFGPPKTMYASIDCTRSSSAPPGEGFFGYKSTNVYLVK